jgi:hypothetical protein
MFLTKLYVSQVIIKAIYETKILRIQYQHTTDSDIKIHNIAPFDIGTTNPKYLIKHKDYVYAYCYDHYNDNRLLDPKIIHFDINYFLSINETGETFDPIDLTDKYKMTSKNHYDYRYYKFAVAPDRKWYKN